MIIKDLKKELKKKEIDYDEVATINVKAENENAIFSEYNYDANEILNPDLENFLIEKARTVPNKSRLRVKIFTNDDVVESEVERAYKNKFSKEFEECERSLKRNMLFALAMFIIGVLFIGFLILEMHIFENYILSIILEVAVWVFIWEAVDAFFLERSTIKRRRYQMARLYYAELEIVTLNFDKIEEKLTKNN